MDCKQLLIDAGLKMINSALTVETWGNISFRDTSTGNIFITPSGMDYDACRCDDILVYKLDGTRVAGERKPSIELELHLSIMRSRPEINAVVHTHPVYSMVFACLKQPIPLIMDEAAQSLGEEIRVAEYALPGTPELAANCVAALGEKGYACLLQSHGAVCIGESMDAAFRTAKVLELTAQIYHMCRQIGEPVPISKENIAIMRDYFRNKYGQGK